MESMDDDLFVQALQTAQIPNLQHLGYTADAHVGKGTAIGTTMVGDLKEGVMISASTVGVDIGCGMSVQLTPLTVSDLQDRRAVRALIEEIARTIRPGEGKKNSLKLNAEELRLVASEGVAKIEGALARWADAADELPFVEGASLSAPAAAAHAGWFEVSGREAISPRAWERTMQTVGTLGGGNHFAEVQVIHITRGMEKLAKSWGLFDGQVVVMLHSGSRGGGHQIAEEHERQMIKEMTALSLPRPNRQMAYVPFHSVLGAAYMHAQTFALNISRINRMLMRKMIRQALERVYGVAQADIGLLYDIAHNYCAIEQQGARRYLIHRKGATRALPPGHPANPPAYRETGHPVLIPGSMGARSRSYILVGRETGVANYYTVNHGAGRAMSRTRARSTISMEEFSQSLTYREAELAALPFELPVQQVMLNKRNLKEVVDEAPDAYKEARAIIDSVVGAGLAEVVAECLPVACIKG
jgi:tRNA-splicing ligase RtcB